MQSVLRKTAGVLVFVVLVAAAAEVGLRVAALFTRDRATPWRAGAPHRVLCVGDSHTYGAGVVPEEAFPAQLQRLLDERAPGAYSVVNFGVPGFSTTQVLHRLPDQIARWRPDVVVVWCGVNNNWNRAEADDEPPQHWQERLERVAVHFRLWKLWSVWRHDAQIQKDIAGQSFGERPPHELTGPFKSHTETVEWGDSVETIRYRPAADRSEQEAERQATRDLAAMSALARAQGVGLVFVTYPLGFPIFMMANRAITAAGVSGGVPVVDSERAMSRLPLEERKFPWIAHPDGAIYREIARDIADVVVGLRPADRP
jgi:hypothetical protein